MRIIAITGLAALLVTACGGEPEAPEDPGPSPSITAETPLQATHVDQIELHWFDCGRIEISDLDDFSSAGDYAGVTDTYTNTCWLVRHPEGNFLWDTGLPGMLVRQGPFQQDIYTVSLSQSLTEQLQSIDLRPADIDKVAISHSHFDHVGQIDQVADAVWLVHTSEYAAMFPDPADGANGESATQFGAFASMTFETFSGEYDVFGDGSVIIFPTPGHTPGHTSLQVTLPTNGVYLLTGDLYHRQESRDLRRVPRFNTDEAQTLDSMTAFEARQQRLDAAVIIQHEPNDMLDLPNPLR